MKPQYGGQSVRQPPHYYSQLVQVPNDVIPISVKQPLSIAVSKSWSTGPGDRYGIHGHLHSIV